MKFYLIYEIMKRHRLLNLFSLPAHCIAKSKTPILFLIFIFTIVTSYPQNKKNDYVITIKTDFGNMIAILYDETPKHKANFIKLAKEHYYDSLLFHRIIEGFMIQTGDPNSKKESFGQRLGTGGPNYTIDAEFSPKLFHEKGSLSAARLTDQLNPSKSSSGSQFYIVQGAQATETDLRIDKEKLNKGLRTLLLNPAYYSLKDSLNQLYAVQNKEGFNQKVISLIPRIEKETGIKILRQDLEPGKIEAYTTVGGSPHLDGEYTVFGKVIKGLEVIDKIASRPKDQADRPTNDIRMFVTVDELPRKKIKKLYGYTYPRKN